MTQPLRIDFAYPGDLAAPTGGYGYDRRVIGELEALGCSVRRVALPGSFPCPTADDLTETARLLAQDGRDALVIDGLAFGALPTALVARLRPRPVALVHHPLFLETGLDATTAARLRASEHAALEHAAAIMTTSRMTADIVAREFSVAANRLFVGEPGVEPAPRAKSADDGIVRLVSVGSLLPRKGYEDLVRALAQTDGAWRLRIIGSLAIAPDHASAVQDLVAALGLEDRISFEGALSAAQVAEAYAQSDAFVTASHFEGFGMAIAEAVARGLPIVAAQEVLAAGAAPADAALAFPAGDVAALAAQLRALASDAGLRRRLSDAAWAGAASQPRWSDAGRALLRAIGAAQQEAAA